MICLLPKNEKYKEVETRAFKTQGNQINETFSRQEFVLLAEI